MPLFEYLCNDCGQPFEVLVLSGSSSTSITCPACQGTQVRKKLSTFASKAASNGGSLSAGSSAASCNTGGG